MNQEHFDKYEALAQKIGIGALKAIIPATRAQVREALQTDEHLNNIPLGKWDDRAGYMCVRGDVKPIYHRQWAAPWLPAVASGLSLAERVCVLKHVARYHYANEDEAGD